ncbi:allantoicase [Actinobacteria bacterium YIM 96077]|uniref:Probable allantoicase n=1 Tax=Phytoactinopolyspora halophila TaxID=1981511 RepID=A0A329R3B0_9ACTN|nr:allantoicase [Phytoactinopolyspora halophila]AYY11884.1 allantoicase [Actinobacteria bacterium YIM 96077]RAW18883.1 allantoicase [Phytoactinopolyspora halophila]
MSWRELPDLAVRHRGGSVLAANDETFGEKENLLTPDPPRFQPYTFGHRGQIVDGWETRRRREPGHDWALVRLGLPGLVRGVVVDTSWFTGNYPQECSVEAACVDMLGTPPGAEELGAAELDAVERRARQPGAVEWTEIVPRTALEGNTENEFGVQHEHLVTHLRLRQYPDGGIARLRVHGEPVGDPRWVAGRVFDLAALEHGARIADCSNRFYSTPDNLLAAGPARVMGEGWETSRRRDADHDWVVVDLAATGTVRQVEIDTSCFIGNAPGEVELTGMGAERVELLPRAELRPDTVHRFLLASDVAVERLRLDIYPDGGLARLRASGEPSPTGRAAFFLRWYNRLPSQVAVAALTGWGGADETWARAVADGRPYDVPDLAERVRVFPGLAPDPAAWQALTGLPWAHR